MGDAMIKKMNFNFHVGVVMTKKMVFNPTETLYVKHSAQCPAYRKLLTFCFRKFNSLLQKLMALMLGFIKL